MSKKIKSVADLADKLKELDEPKKGYTRFFRGHSNKDYKLEPSIYRKDDKAGDKNYLINNEDKIIKDAFTYCSDYFLPHETLFERLTKLQHYDYKTRLLDISSNSLVALYFAIAKSDKQEVSNPYKNGEIVVLDIPNEHIKYDDSDVVSVLSAISLRKYDFELENYISNSEAQAIAQAGLLMVKEKSEKKIYSNNYDYMSDPILSPLFRESNLTPNQLLTILGKNRKEEVFKEVFNKQPEIMRLLHDIRKDKPSFAPIIKVEDFSRVVCVKAKQNNPRIARQQGAFLLFGIDGQKIKQAKVDDDWVVSNKNKLIIDNTAKQDILNELKSFGISHQSLFPELDSQANDIINKYKNIK